MSIPAKNLVPCETYPLIEFSAYVRSILATQAKYPEAISPDHALEMIRVQLKMLDLRDQASREVETPANAA